MPGEFFCAWVWAETGFSPNCLTRRLRSLPLSLSFHIDVWLAYTIRIKSRFHAEPWTSLIRFKNTKERGERTEPTLGRFRQESEPASREGESRRGPGGNSGARPSPGAERTAGQARRPPRRGCLSRVSPEPPVEPSPAHAASGRPLPGRSWGGGRAAQQSAPGASGWRTALLRGCAARPCARSSCVKSPALPGACPDSGARRGGAGRAGLSLGQFPRGLLEDIGLRRTLRAPRCERAPRARQRFLRTRGLGSALLSRSPASPRRGPEWRPPRPSPSGPRARLSGRPRTARAPALAELRLGLGAGKAPHGRGRKAVGVGRGRGSRSKGGK